MPGGVTHYLLTTPKAMLQPQEPQEAGILVLSVKMTDEQVECLLGARYGHTPQQVWCRLFSRCCRPLGTDISIVQIGKLRLGGRKEHLPSSHNCEPTCPTLVPTWWQCSPSCPPSRQGVPSRPSPIPFPRLPCCWLMSSQGSWKPRRPLLALRLECEFCF